jgi:high-affinity iron transporter
MTAAFAQTSAETENQVRQTWQILDYLAVDYAGAVSGGKVAVPSEYAEMQEFSQTARSHLASLPPKEERAALLSRADELIAAVRDRKEATEVARLAHDLADGLLASYPIPLAPRTVPDATRGARLFESTCASCHGATGDGKGPAAAALDPPPIAFTDPARARERSLFSLYQTISQGVSGTSMASFGALPEADRWALAFHVGRLAYPADVAQAGETRWTSDAALKARVPSLEALTRTSEAALAADVGDAPARELLGYLRSHPEAVLSAANLEVLALARTRLSESVTAYRAGDSVQATRLALSAYLDGYEPIEPLVSVRNPELLARVERAMGEYRGRIAHHAPIESVEAQARELQTLLSETGTMLGNSRSSAMSVFLGSYTILVREGLEALLIVVAIIAFLRKAKREDALVYVHAGWVLALLAGVLTWGVATYFINTSGASRELTEGLSSLFAAAVLLSVGLWMHGKSLAGRWQQYIDAQLSRIMTKRSLWLLGGLAFVAVYREVFETILFYAALWSQGNGSSILGGLAAGAVTLAAIATSLLRYSRRLPIGKFFLVSSIFIAVLAVVLTGKGIAALQEAGLVGVHPISFPRIELLGVYPSWQTVLWQTAVVILAVAGFILNRRSAAKSAPRIAKA